VRGPALENLRGGVRVDRLIAGLGGPAKLDEQLLGVRTACAALLGQVELEQRDRLLAASAEGRSAWADEKVIADAG